MGWIGNPGADTDAALALQWLSEGAAAFRYNLQAALPSPIVLVDVETTRDRIVEIAAIRLQRGAWPVTWHTWIDPGPEARHRSGRYWNTKIHGLTAPIVVGAPTFAQIAGPLWTLCGDATVVAHNVAFEHRQLVLEYGRLGGMWVRPAMCTLRLARTLLAGRKTDGLGHTLDELAPLLNVRNPAPHRAIGDVVTTLWITLALLERFAARSDLGQVVRDAYRIHT